MQIFKSLKNIIKKKSIGNFMNFGGRIANFFGSDDRELLGKYKGWIYRCVDTTSNEVAAVPLKLYQGDKEVDNSHELNKILNNPNLLQSRTDLLKATQSFLSLHGDAFWYLARDGQGNGKIREIWPLRPGPKG